MKKLKFLAVLSLPFLLMSCNSGSGGGSSSSGEEVDFKTFVTKLADSVEKNEFFIKDGIKSDKELKADGNITFVTKATINGKEEVIDNIKASASGTGKFDIDNEIARADLKYDLALANSTLSREFDGKLSGQLQGDNGKLYAVNLKNNAYIIVNENFASFKDYLNYIPNALANTPDWKNTYVNSINSAYDQMMSENAEFKKAMESGILKYYADGDKFALKFSGETSLEYPVNSYSVDSVTGEASTEKTMYKLAINVSGSYTVKLDLTNGKESLSMNGKASVNVTVKDVIEDYKLKYGSLVSLIMKSFIGGEVTYYELGSNDSLQFDVNAKLSASLKDSNVTLEKAAL